MSNSKGGATFYNNRLKEKIRGVEVTSLNNQITVTTQVQGFRVQRSGLRTRTTLKTRSSR